MKKLLISGFFVTLVLVGGVGAVWASESGISKVSDKGTFEEMLPFMKKMHPGLTEETFREMYNACHSNGGMMANDAMQR